MSSSDRIDIPVNLLLRGLAFEDFLGTEYLLVLRSDLTIFPGEQSSGAWKRVRPSVAVRCALQDALRSSNTFVEAFLDGGAHGGRTSTTLAILEELEHSAGTGRYIIFCKVRPMMSAKPHLANVDEEDERDEDETVTTEEVTDFIGIELVDAEGIAVSDAKVKVEYPDGTVNDHRTDAKGLVYIHGIDPGICKVEFVDADIN